MKKRKFIFFISLASLGICLTMFPILAGILVFLAGAAAGCALRMLNRFIKKSMTPPGLLNDSRRNFDYLLLGSTRIWGRFAVNSKGANGRGNCICFARPFSNLWADYLVLQHMHSYLKPGGAAVVAIDFVGLEKLNARKLNYGDLQNLHPVTVTSLGMEFGGKRAAWPIVFSPAYCLKYAVSFLKFRFWSKGQSVTAIGKMAKNGQELCESDLMDAQELLQKMHDFCKTRSIRSVVLLLGREGAVMKAWQEVVESLCERNPDGLWEVSSDPERVFEYLK